MYFVSNKRGEEMKQYKVVFRAGETPKHKYVVAAGYHAEGETYVFTNESGHAIDSEYIWRVARIEVVKDVQIEQEL